MKRFLVRPLVLRHRVSLVCLVTVCAALGCGGRAATGPDVVVRLGERDISYADFEEYLRVNSLDGEVGLASPVLSGLFDQFLFEELLLEAARDQGVTGADRRRIVDKLVDTRAAAAVGETEVEAYFAEHPEEFDLPERVSLRQILVDDRATAQAALARLRGGEAFEAVARSVQAGDGPAGWVQTDLSRDAVPPLFADTIFALEENEVSEIVEADYGFFIFEVTSHKPSAQLTLDGAAASIRRKLKREAADQALVDLVSDASQRYNIAVFEQNLPFDYRGNYRRKSPTP